MSLHTETFSTSNRWRSFPLLVSFIVILGLGLPILGSTVSAWIFPEWKWADSSFHMLIEILGGGLALVLGVLLIRHQHTHKRQLYFWVGCGLIGMGILDVFHALVEVGKIFVWFHSTATFVGGMLFMVGWWQREALPIKLSRRIPLAIGLGSVLFGCLSLGFSDLIPAMVLEGQFTLLAKSLNVLGGLGFFVTAALFVHGLRTHFTWDDWLFAIHCTLFGAAGVLFELSTLWDAGWWWWHGLRLIAYGTGLQCIFAFSERTSLDDFTSSLPEDRNDDDSTLLFRNSQSGKWLPMIIVVVTTVSLGMGGITLYFVHDHLINKEGEALAFMASNMAQQLETYVIERKRDIQLITHAPDFQEANKPAMSAYLQTVANTHQEYLGLSFINRQGITVASTAPTLLGKNLVDDTVVMSMQQAAQFHIEDVQPIPYFNHALALTLIAPVLTSDGQYQGMLLGYVGIQPIERIIKQVVQASKDLDENRSFLEWQVLRSNGLVIIDSILREEGEVNLRTMGVPSAQLVEKYPAGYVNEQHLRRKIPVITGYARTPDIQDNSGMFWKILVRKDQAEVLASVTAIEAKLGLVGAGIVLPLIAVLLVSVRRLHAAQTRANQARHFAQKSEAQNRLILNSAGEGIYGIDTQGNTIFVNPAAAEMLGYAPEELIGVAMHSTVHHSKEDGSPYLREDYPMYAAFMDGAVHRIVDEVLWRKDGTSFPVEYTSVPIRNEFGDLDGAVVTFQNISTRKQAQEALNTTNQELTVARDNALVAVRSKAMFLATMSHEIRTPMNGILGMAELLASTDLSADQQDLTQTLRSSGENLLTIINDILDFSKIESGKLTIEQTDFDLRTSVEEILNIFTPQVQAKGLDLVGLVHANTPTALRGDPVRLRQVMTNFIGNALKFTSMGEIFIQVTPLEVSNSHAHIRIEVKDTGIGIDLEEQEHLFQAFTQANQSTTRKFGGTGLGLAICRQLIELMQGEFGLESTPGIGSCFWFTVRLPIQPGIPMQEIPEVSLKDRRILFVDDHATSRFVLDHYGESWGMHSSSASSGSQALILLEAAAEEGQPFDVMVIDKKMPGMDGFELAHVVKANPRWLALPLILLTAFDDKNEEENAKQAHFSGYLTKPIHQQTLRRSVTQVLGLQQDSPDKRASAFITHHTVQELVMTEKPHILLAEDNVVNQKVAVKMLTKLGYQVDVANNGQEAFEAWEKKRYDIILMDCLMPEMDGLQTTEKIRQAESVKRETLGVRDEAQNTDPPSALPLMPHENFHIPIIALTANTMAGDREKCLEAGMDDFIPKPVNMEFLGNVLAKWLSGQNDLEQNVTEDVSQVTPRVSS